MGANRSVVPTGVGMNAHAFSGDTLRCSRVCYPQQIEVSEQVVGLVLVSLSGQPPYVNGHYSNLESTS